MYLPNATHPKARKAIYRYLFTVHVAKHSVGAPNFSHAKTAAWMGYSSL